MKLVITVFLATILAQTFAIPADRIENGKPATDKLHAVIILSLARVGDQRAAFGGGSIISPRHILTAAHLCINAKEFRIGYGDVKARDVIRLTANSALIHSHFNQATLENDIAIIPLSNGQTFNENIAKIIPIARNSPPMSREGVVASFGFTSNTASTISERLMVARQVVIPNGDCREVFKRAVHRNQFCAQDQPPQPPAEEEAPAEEETPPEGGDTPPAEGGGASPGEGGGASPGEETPSEGGQGGFPSYDWGEFGRSLTRRAEPDVVLSAVCRGDTGSALVYKVDDKYIAYGLVSRVPNGCNRKQPALYTSLSAFIQWIEDATLGAAEIVNA